MKENSIQELPDAAEEESRVLWSRHQQKEGKTEEDSTKRYQTGSYMNLMWCPHENPVNGQHVDPEWGRSLVTTAERWN